MEFFDSTLFDVLITLVVLGLGLQKVGAWVINKKIDVIAGKSEEVLERIASGMEGIAVVAKGAGFDKVGTFFDEAADPVQKLSDLAGTIEDITASQDFSKEKIIEAVDAGKDVVVEGKDFWLKVVKKPE